jgi:hypothetical protein
MAVPPDIRGCFNTALNPSQPNEAQAHTAHPHRALLGESRVNGHRAGHWKDGTKLGNAGERRDTSEWRRLWHPDRLLRRLTTQCGSEKNSAEHGNGDMSHTIHLRPYHRIPAIGGNRHAPMPFTMIADRFMSI